MLRCAVVQIASAHRQTSDQNSFLYLESWIKVSTLQLQRHRISFNWTLRTAQPSRQIISFCLPTVFADLWCHIQKINIESVRVYLIIYYFICFPKQFCGVTREYRYNRAARRYLNRHLPLHGNDAVAHKLSGSNRKNPQPQPSSEYRIQLWSEHQSQGWASRGLGESTDSLYTRNCLEERRAMSWCGAPRWKCWASWRWPGPGTRSSPTASRPLRKETGFVKFSSI